MSAVSMKQLLESGVHFGHQTRRWNPKMRRYIYGERGGIYIIDLQQTIVLLERARSEAREIARRDGTVLFVGTKKQCQESVRAEAIRCGMPYVSHRWLGGLLTNWGTISSRIQRLHELRRQKKEGQLELLPTRERLTREAELAKLETNLGGVADMERLPDAVVIVDLKKEAIAVREANRLGLEVIGLVDTNCDPDEATIVIPGNDDAIRSCGLVLRTLADAVLEGRGVSPTPEVVASNGHGEGEAAPAGAAAPATSAASAEPAPEQSVPPEAADPGAVPAGSAESQQSDPAPAGGEGAVTVSETASDGQEGEGT